MQTSEYEEVIKIKTSARKMKKKRRKNVKYTAYFLFGEGSKYGVGKIKKIAEGATLEEIRKKARSKRRVFSGKTGEWAQIMIYRNDKFHEML